MTDSQLAAWLEKTNRNMGQEELPYVARPFEAMSRWSIETGSSLTMPSPLSDTIFKWFEEHAPAGAHSVGSMFSGTFYYDAYFWRVSIPIVYGMVQLNALDSIQELPPSIREQLEADKRLLWLYMCVWIDSLDYALGFDDLGQGARLPESPNKLFAAGLLQSADRELRATVHLLTEDQQPSTKAMETARMAVEIFLKTYLAVHGGFDEVTLKAKYGHNLAKLAEECRQTHNRKELTEIVQLVRVFPEVSARYQGQKYTNHELWSAYAVALFTATTFTRSLTDRDSRSHMHQVQQL